MSDYGQLKEWVENLRGRLVDNRQNGHSPELSATGKDWRFSFMPKGLMSMEVDQIQALFRFFDIPEIKPVEYGGECCDCIHGHGVSRGSTGLWPVIEDCEDCLSPSHPHFISYNDLVYYVDIKPEHVFDIPGGGIISFYLERLKKDMEESRWHYANVGGWAVRISDGKRICKVKSIGKLDIPGHLRWRTHQKEAKDAKLSSDI